MVFRLLDGRYSTESKVKIVVGYILLVFGVLLLIAALPRNAPMIIDLKLIKLNVGSELDILRVVIGVILGYIGFKGVKLKW